MACLNPAKEAGFSSGVFDKVIDAVHQQGKTVIVIGCQLPYDAARFPEADAILLTYWDSAMREPPAKDDPLWSPNLPAGLLACFGAGEAGGTLPVQIPALDANYQPTDEILWPRGACAR
jgi:beta-N-acetylhexosaminidase